MILISAILVVAAIAVLIVGIVATQLTLVYVSIAISVVSAIMLGVGVFLRRRELFGSESRRVSGRAAAATAGTGTTAVLSGAVTQPTGKGGEKVEPARGGATAKAADAVGKPQTAAPVAAVDVPSDAIVYVVPGRKRYHLESCRQLAGRDKEELTWEEAREEGFSACSACMPDTALVARAGLAGGAYAPVAVGAASDSAGARARTQSSGHLHTAGGSRPSSSTREASARGEGDGRVEHVDAEHDDRLTAGRAGDGSPADGAAGEADETVASAEVSTGSAADGAATPDTQTDGVGTGAAAGPGASRDRRDDGRDDSDDSDDTAPGDELPVDAACDDDGAARVAPAGGRGSVEDIADDTAEEAAEAEESAEKATENTSVSADRTADGAADRAVTADGTTADRATDADSEEAGEAEPVEAEADDSDLVHILVGTKRYHRADCALVSIADGDGDVESMSRAEAEAKGCSPCSACQPDKEPAHS